MSTSSEPLSVTSRTRTYYDTPTTDAFYSTLWGGSDLHVGIYHSHDDSIGTASQRSVEHLVSLLPPITKHSRILDLGSGYGGVARYLATTYGCHVTGVNLSIVQNERNRLSCRAAGLEKLVTVIDGTFESMPQLPDLSFDIIWSQDSFLHSGNRSAVLDEIDRLLVREGGNVVFTDIMQSKHADLAALGPVLERLPVDDLGSVGFYQKEMRARGFAGVGWVEEGWEEMTEQFVMHYSKVLEMLEGDEGRKVRAMGGEEWVEKVGEGTRAWIQGGEEKYLIWGCFCFTR